MTRTRNVAILIFEEVEVLGWEAAMETACYMEYDWRHEVE